MRTMAVAFCLLNLGGCTLVLGMSGYTKGEAQLPDAAKTDGAIPDGSSRPDSPIDATVDATPIDGILCGNASVCALGQACCSTLPPGTGSWSTSTCSSNVLACKTKGSAALACDDSSDCTAATVCCLRLTSGVPIESACEPECATNDAWLCTSDGECPASRPTCRARSYAGDLAWLRVCE
jgi:hypothetical protein